MKKMLPALFTSLVGELTGDPFRRNSMRKLSIIILLFMLLFSGVFANGETKSAAMKKFTPFIGKWKTLSLYPDRGLQVPGDLEYRWVLGKDWVLCDFVGRHPERNYWAAIAMIKFDAAKNRYISYDFFNADDPTTMTGHWISSSTIRFEVTDDNGSSGIDYSVTEDGSIYQENWVLPKGKTKRITLKTDYTRKK
jgi:hypothetical protein